MKIDVKFYPTYEEITVQGGQIDEDGTLWVDWCNHANMAKEKSYIFDGSSDGYIYRCDKCDECFDVWEVESDPEDGDWAYDSWKDSQL